ncbi:hypothetical protein [Simkania sp.]|uniref:hypothetical protein n=1 Tax=Simkania sp. TaxID=34094 RepID=UPI003B525C71
MKRWAFIALMALVFARPGHGAWLFWETEVSDQAEEITIEQPQDYGPETYERAYGYLRGGAAILGGGCLVGLAAFGVVSLPAASLAAVLIGMGLAEIHHANNIVDYSIPENREHYVHELEDIPLWAAVDQFEWQELIDRGFLTPDQMRIKFFEDTQDSSFHEIERFYSVPAITAQGFLHQDESEALLAFHRQFLELQSDEEHLRESLSEKYARKVGLALQGLGIEQPWTTNDFIFFKITPEKASVAFSEDLKRCMDAHHLNGEVRESNDEILDEAVEDYKAGFQKWLSQVQHLDQHYWQWRSSVSRD